MQRKMERLRDIVLEGDLDLANSRKRKVVLTEELAMLPAAGAPQEEVGVSLARFLADVRAARDVATGEKKNWLARRLFNAVAIENGTVVEATPRPELLPCFVSVSEPNTFWRKRRDSNPRSQP